MINTESLAKLPQVLREMLTVLSPEETETLLKQAKAQQNFSKFRIVFCRRSVFFVELEIGDDLAIL